MSTTRLDVIDGRLQSLHCERQHTRNAAPAGDEFFHPLK
jgi:hypothetical protein